MDSNKKIKFGVFDNGRPVSADSFPYLRRKGWLTNLFDTLEAANKAVKRWLGDDFSVGELTPDSPVDYSGYGDIIEIRMIEVM